MRQRGCKLCKLVQTGACLVTCAGRGARDVQLVKRDVQIVTLPPSGIKEPFTLITGPGKHSQGQQVNAHVLPRFSRWSDSIVHRRSCCRTCFRR